MKQNRSVGGASACAPGRLIRTAKALSAAVGLALSLAAAARVGRAEPAALDEPYPNGSYECAEEMTKRGVAAMDFLPGTPETDAFRFYSNTAKTAYVEFNYDESKAGVLGRDYTLEDPLTFADGRKVADPAQWPARRLELLDLFSREVYGRMPPKPEAMAFDLLEEKMSDDRFATLRRYRQYFRADKSGPVVDWFVAVPRHAKGKVPVFLHLNYAGLDSIAAQKTNHYNLPWDMLIANGYAFMSARYTQITGDGGKRGGVFNGVCALWGRRDPHAGDRPGSLIIWAWGLSRGLDLAEQIPEIDASRNVVIGSSRLGKAALLAAAYDERFQVCIPNQTGAVGVQLMKRDYGESLKGQRLSLPHWYCPNVWTYADNPRSQPFDQHLLLACVAPRNLLLECYHKKWFDPKGEFLAAQAASSVWTFLTGKGLGLSEMPPAYDDGCVVPPFGYVRRTECHGLSPYDWKWAIDFANKVYGAGRAATDACPHWLSVMPLNEGNAASIAADAVALGEETIIDGIAWCCSIHPAGDPPADKAAIYAARYRETAPLVRARSRVKMGILLQSTMGHGGFPGARTPWQLAVHPDGTQTYRFCPLDRRLLDYVARACRTFDAEKPDFFMVDDDTRLVWEPVPGCFCPLHLAKLAEATGRAWTREEVVAKLREGDAALAATWERIKVESMAGLFRTIRANFSPSVPGMLCVVGAPAHFRHARAFAEILAAPGQTPVIRGSGAPYHGYGLDALHVADMRARYAWQMEQVGPGVVYLQEADSCPQTLWACSAARLANHLVMLPLDGVKGAKIWITRTANNHEKRSFETYRRAFREQRAIMEWAAKADFRPQGVVLPHPKLADGNLFHHYFAQMGIPHRYGKARAGEVVALDGSTAKALAKDELREILAGRVLVDSIAAVWLAANGFAEEIGVRAKAWDGPTIQFQQFADGVRHTGSRRDKVADLSDLLPGAQALSWLFNQPRMGEPAHRVAPGSVLAVNARGGRVVVLAYPVPNQTEPYYASHLYSETYKDEIAKALVRLGGSIPGGLYYRGASKALCDSGETTADGRVFALDLLGEDDDPAPEFLFAAPPKTLERLGDDGVWHDVPFVRRADGSVVLATTVRPQRAAIFRVR